MFFMEEIFYQHDKNNKILMIIGSMITLLCTIEINIRFHQFSFFSNNNILITSTLSILRASSRGSCNINRNNSFYDLSNSFRSSAHNNIRSINKPSYSTHSKTNPFITLMLPKSIKFNSISLITAIVSLYGKKPRFFYFIKLIIFPNFLFLLHKRHHDKPIENYMCY